MFFASDNAGPVHPQVMTLLAEANKGSRHALRRRRADGRGARTAARRCFEAPEAAVHLVATGTAANALALATLCEPWQTVFCCAGRAYPRGRVQRAGVLYRRRQADPGAAAATR